MKGSSNKIKTPEISVVKFTDALTSILTKGRLSRSGIIIYITQNQCCQFQGQEDWTNPFLSETNGPEILSSLVQNMSYTMQLIVNFMLYNIFSITVR